MRYKLTAATFCLLLCTAAGCSSGEPSPYGGKAELVLRVSPGSMSGSGTQGQVWFGMAAESGKYTEVWGASAGQNGEIHMNDPHFYPSDNSRIYLRGFAPQAKSVEGDTVRFTIDGKTDLIASNEQSGCLTDMFWQEKKAFRFSHLLSQLRFEVCCDEAALKNGWKLSALYVADVRREVALSLNAKTLTFSGDKTDMEVSVELTPLKETWTKLPEKVLIQPDVRIYLTAVVEDSGGRKTRLPYLPVTFREGGSKPVAGTSYLLSVKLGAGGACYLSAGITKWEPGNNGSTVI